MIYHFTAHPINCVCHRIMSMFRVLGTYRGWAEIIRSFSLLVWKNWRKKKNCFWDFLTFKGFINDVKPYFPIQLQNSHEEEPEEFILDDNKIHRGQMNKEYLSVTHHEFELKKSADGLVVRYNDREFKAVSLHLHIQSNSNCYQYSKRLASCVISWFIYAEAINTTPSIKPECTIFSASLIYF